MNSVKSCKLYGRCLGASAQQGKVDANRSQVCGNDRVEAGRWSVESGIL